MGKSLRRVGLVARFALSLIFVCSSVLADVHVNERVFTFRIRDEPETLDWNRAHTPVESYILMNLMEGLVAFDSSLKIIPALAQSWSVSSEGRVYTFNLRKDAKWSDGVGLKAQDFVYSWRRLLSPLTAASYAYILFDVVGAEDFNTAKISDFSQVGIKALDDYTFQVTLKTPVSHWLEIPAFWVTFPLRRDIVEKYGNGWETPGRMVTVGPFSLISHDLYSNIMMKSNVFYYGSRGNVDKVIAMMVKDDAAALSLYENGKLDFLTDLATVDLKRLKGRADLKIYPHLKTGYLAFVTEKYPISNVKLRRAIAMAIDKSKISKLLYGEQTPATAFVPPQLMGYSKNLGLPFNPKLALSEFRQSGVSESAKLMKMEFIIPDWDKVVEIGKFIQSELKNNLGLDVQLTPMENKIYRNQVDLHSHPLFYATWTADYPDPDNFLSIFLSTAGNGRTTWKNDLFDQGVLQARTQRDLKQREQLYVKLQKILIEDEAVIVPLYYEPNLALVHPRVRNFQLNAMDYLYLRKVDVTP